MIFLLRVEFSLVQFYMLSIIRQYCVFIKFKQYLQSLNLYDFVFTIQRCTLHLLNLLSLANQFVFRSIFVF